mgnify:CR=1 FL=1
MIHFDPGEAPRRAAIFGGTFDPVHRGHLAMAAKAREVAGLDRVCFVPARVSPFKDKPVANNMQRLTMLKIALRESGFAWAEASDIELERASVPSFSWQTARQFAITCPETEWFWILGSDQWEQIEQWAEPEMLRDLLHFLVFTRDEQPIRERRNWQYTAIPFAHPASATAIRADFARHRDWLLPGVFQYCQESRLYT